MRCVCVCGGGGVGRKSRRERVFSSSVPSSLYDVSYHVRLTACTCMQIMYIHIYLKGYSLLVVVLEPDLQMVPRLG